MASYFSTRRSRYDDDHDPRGRDSLHEDRRRRKDFNGEPESDLNRAAGRSSHDGRRDERYSRHKMDLNHDYGKPDDRRHDTRRDHPSTGDRHGHRDRERDLRRDGRDISPSRAGPSRRSASPRARSNENPRPSSRPDSQAGEEAAEDKAKPNFKPSGLLAAETKTVKRVDGTSTVLKYHEPPEARKPVVGWRLYVFKGKEQVDLLHIHRQSAYLIGRDRTVADIPVEHPSCSKQHAVIQFRHVHEKNEFGDAKSVVKPFIIDLESTNGTQVNDEQIPTSRYYELVPGDVIKFGESLREYVILHDEAS